MLKGAYLTLQISECRDRAIYCKKNPQYQAEAELYTMAALGYQTTLQNSSLDELMEDIELPDTEAPTTKVETPKGACI